MHLTSPSHRTEVCNENFSYAVTDCILNKNVTPDREGSTEYLEPSFLLMASRRRLVAENIFLRIRSRKRACILFDVILQSKCSLFVYDFNDHFQVFFNKQSSLL